jgi:hypothetical protein
MEKRMKEDFKTNETRGGGEPPQALPAGAGKLPFVAPKLTFVKPELVRQGSLADVTAGFFGTFIP